MAINHLESDKPGDRKAEQKNNINALDLMRDFSSIHDVGRDLREDVDALKHDRKGTAAYERDLAELHRDEASLKQDVHSFIFSAPDYQTFASQMQGMHSELKSVANDLWSMGFKQEASQTTAYYPLTHYKKYFHDSTGTPGGGGGGGGNGGGSGDGGSTGGGGAAGGDGGVINPPPNSKPTDGNLAADPQAWRIILGKGSQQHGIGGSGNVDGSTVTQDGPDGMRYTTTGGQWGDSLIGRTVRTPNDATHYQLKSTFNLDASYIKNGQMFEKDIVVTKQDGSHAVIGTQINPKNGEVYFWDQKAWQEGRGGWISEGSVTGGAPLQANRDYHLELDAHLANGQYVYDNYSLNGKSVAMPQRAFSQTQSNWSAGAVIQTQEDLAKVPDGTTISAVIKDETITAW